MKFLKKKLKLRLYQETILNTAINKNTLCVIPTGLGKTFIAIALTGIRLNQFSENKIIILAPTRPLIDQHKKTFSEFFEYSEEEAILITGDVPPNIRKKQFRDAKIIFSTPQCIQNDLKNSRISLENVSLLVIDEAHRAIGEYSYVYVAQKYKEQSRHFKILALTASPGANESKISEICENLHISAIEIRDREHAEVKEYVKPLNSEILFVDFPKKMILIRKYLESAISEKTSYLYKKRLIKSQDIKKIRKKDIIRLQMFLIKRLKKKDYSIAKATSDCAFLLKTFHALRLLESESLSAFVMYANRLFSEDDKKSKAVKNMLSNPSILYAIEMAKKELENGLEHPKLELLKKVVEEQLRINKYSKILIFTEFRDNILKIVETLEKIKLCSVQEFIGQSSKSTKGMSQKKQVEVLEKFKEGYITCLIATAVAEEGIDVPDVDLVVFYTPVPSAIRSIQRRGRTARKKEGSLKILITKNTRDEGIYWIGKRREKGMELATKKLAKKPSKGQISLKNYENNN